MPSHQAPAFLLKRWRPDWFSGPGLALGTLVPDLDFIVPLSTESLMGGHTLTGQIYYTVPCVLLLYRLATDLVVPWLVPYLPRGLAGLLLGIRRLAGGEWRRVIGSAVVGGLTHLGLDGFTHGDGWAVEYFPGLRAAVPCPWAPVPVYDILQHGLSALLAVFVFRAIQDLAKRKPILRPLVPASLRARLGLVAWLAACAIAGVLLPTLLRPETPPNRAFELSLYGALDMLVVGLLAAAATARLRRWRWPAREWIADGAPCS